METKEKNFENDIESYLLSHGYVKGDQATYDKSKAIIAESPILNECTKIDNLNSIQLSKIDSLK